MNCYHNIDVEKANAPQTPAPETAPLTFEDLESPTEFVKDEAMDLDLMF